MEMLIIGIVSLLSGIAASMGLGGGFILLIYCTTFAGIPQMEAQWINLIFFLPIGALSLLFHKKNGLLVKSAILPSILTGAVGVTAGVEAAKYLGNEQLTKIFAVFLLLVGVKELFFVKKKPLKEKIKEIDK
ncbi:MAG: sulfite exporter TauE/SafE family protein [Oscillospiraceae bacterium]